MAAEFSLNTQMYLLSKKSLWLSDGSMGFGQESDVAFAEGITLQMRGILYLSCISFALCFLGIVFEGGNYSFFHGFENVTESVLMLAGVGSHCNWVYVTGYLFTLRKLISSCLT